MVEVIKLGNRTLVVFGRRIDVFEGGVLKVRCWYYLPSSWKYYRPIIIEEQSGRHLTGYQVLIELRVSNFDFDHATDDGRDIRFTPVGKTPEDGELYPYWIEEWDAVNKKAKIWVKVPEIPANGRTTIWMYYGNPNAEPMSSGEETFEIFDNFDDEDISDWNQEVLRGSGSWNATGGTLNPTGYGEPVHIRCYKFYSGKNVAVKYRVKFDSYTDDESAQSILYVDDNNSYAYRITGSGVYGHGLKLQFNRTINGEFTEEDIGSWAGDNNWHTMEWRRFDGEFEFYFDDSLVATRSETDIGNLTRFIFHAHAYKNDLNHHYDDLIVRKYTKPEPSVYVGEERII